ncbi:MAG: hypothetical protein COB15_05025 [Flavobacteriales bacterium]|nr:MAG: hypothetical protein COB15_05025 [Flavobacteriales bacterium]
MITTLTAKKKSLSVDKDVWEKTIEEIDYTETFKELNKPKTENTPSLNYDWSGLKYLFYIIVVGLVLFLLFKILNNLKVNPNIKKQDISIEAIEEIEEKIHEIDLQKLLEEAILQENYHVALRINFLIIIKLLSEQKQIVWAKEKTNWEYYSEIKDILKKDCFKQIILSFEPVWYGEHLLTKEGFEKLQPLFINYQDQLTPND